MYKGCTYKGNLQIGDLVTRIIKRPMDQHLSDQTGHLGLVVSRQMSGTPLHPTVEVWWMKSAQTYSIAERLVEVVCSKDKE